MPRADHEPYGLQQRGEFPRRRGRGVGNPVALAESALLDELRRRGLGVDSRTLPGNGSWLSFWVKGTGTSAIDKSAIIEMATSGSCSNGMTDVVVARKAMMIPSGAPPIAVAANPQVEIEINSTPATLDDYVTCVSTGARVRWINGSAGNTVNVTVASAGATPLVFADNTLGAGATATNATLPLTLTGDGAWVNFFVAGQFPAAPPRGSMKDKDAILEVRNASNAPIGREGLMVRIRKNANTLGTDERDRYIAALTKINATYATTSSSCARTAATQQAPADRSSHIARRIAARGSCRGIARSCCTSSVSCSRPIRAYPSRTGNSTTTRRTSSRRRSLARTPRAILRRSPEIPSTHGHLPANPSLRRGSSAKLHTATADIRR